MSTQVLLCHAKDTSFGPNGSQYYKSVDIKMEQLLPRAYHIDDYTLWFDACLESACIVIRGY